MRARPGEGRAIARPRRLSPAAPLAARRSSHRDRVYNEAPGGLADADPASRAHLLELDGDVYRVARNEGLARSGVAGEHPPGVDADAERVASSEAVTQLHRRAHRAQRVVLVCARDAEDSQDAAGAEALDGSPVSLEHRCDQLE